MNLPVNCFRCDTDFVPADKETMPDYPYRGTVFVAYGQYGSTVFDPMDDTFLEINICDYCLAANSVRVRKGREAPVAFRTIYTAWNPEEEDDG